MSNPPTVDETQEAIVADRVEMVLSLMEALERAGGGPRTYSEIRKIPMGRIIDEFAQNGIRFCFVESNIKRLNKIDLPED